MSPALDKPLGAVDQPPVLDSAHTPRDAQELKREPSPERDATTTTRAFWSSANTQSMPIDAHPDGTVEAHRRSSISGSVKQEGSRGSSSDRDTISNPSLEDASTAEGSARPSGGSSGGPASTTPTTSGTSDPASSKPRRTRALLTRPQSTALNNLWNQTMFPSTNEREALAVEIGLTARQVQVWFQNQRQKRRRERENDETVPPFQMNQAAPYPSHSTPSATTSWGPAAGQRQHGWAPGHYAQAPPQHRGESSAYAEGSGVGRGPHSLSPHQSPPLRGQVVAPPRRPSIPGAETERYPQSPYGGHPAWQVDFGREPLRSQPPPHHSMADQYGHRPRPGAEIRSYTWPYPPSPSTPRMPERASDGNISLTLRRRGDIYGRRRSNSPDPAAAGAVLAQAPQSQSHGPSVLSNTSPRSHLPASLSSLVLESSVDETANPDGSTLSPLATAVPLQSDTMSSSPRERDDTHTPPLPRDAHGGSNISRLLN